MTSIDAKLNLRTPDVPPDLGYRATRGFVWMISQTIGVKLVSLVANVVLAWFLVPGDAGLVGISYIVLSLAGIVQYIGMQDVLVQRQAHFRRWAVPAFWMSLTVGLIGGGLSALAAPLAARLAHEPRLLGMILLLAIASPIQTTSMVPQAMLSAKLRFQRIVIIGTAAAVGNSILSIVFAALGLKAYSMLLPMPIIAAAQAAALWWSARPPFAWRPQLHLWKYLIGDTGYSWGISVSQILITTSDHIVLIVMFPKDVVGIYFWAVNLSTQLLRLLATNLMGVLLPSLSKLQGDPIRQTSAFLQATRMLAAIGIPACLLQAALAEPLVRILYKSDWQSVGPVLGVLSVGMAFNFVNGPATSMMKAQGRFKSAFVVYGLNALAMIVAVTLAAWRSDQHTAALHVAIAAATCLGAFGPICLYRSLKPSGRAWHGLWQVFAAPTAASVLAIGAGITISKFIGQVPARDYIVIAVVSGITAAIYPFLIRWMDPDVWRMLIGRIRSLQRRSDAGVDSPVSGSD